MKNVYSVVALVVLMFAAACSSASPEGPGGSGGGAPGYTVRCPADFPVECNGSPTPMHEYEPVCVDLQTDYGHCGACGTKCPIDANFNAVPCIAGVCVSKDGGVT